MPAQYSAGNAEDMRHKAALVFALVALRCACADAMTRKYMETPGNLRVAARKPCSVSSQWLIYTCRHRTTEHCGGWGDRWKGIRSSYILAQRAQRCFAIDMEVGGADLRTWLRPARNGYNWTVPTLPASGTTTSFYHWIDVRAPPVEKVLQDKSQVVRVLWNKYIEHGNNLPAELQRAEFDSFFELSPMMLEHQRHLLRQLDHRPLTCAQVRVGANPTIPDDMVRLDAERQIQATQDWIDQQLFGSKSRGARGSSSGSALLVWCDSEEVRRRWRARYNASWVEVEGIITHIDRSPPDMVLRWSYKTFLDW